MQEKRKLLFIPADAITNEISRSFYLAKGLSERFDVYLLFWDDAQNSDFLNVQGNKLYTLKCFFKSLFSKMQIIDHPKYNYKLVKAPRLLILLLYRIVGHKMALRIVRAFNRYILKRIARKINPEIYFYADGFDNYPIIDYNKINISDVQDDFSEGNFRDNKYQKKYGNKYFNLSNHNFIVTNAAAQKLGNYYHAKFNFLPNGADFEGLKKVDRKVVDNLKTELGLKDKYIVSYIGGRAWMDTNFTEELLKQSLIQLPDVHYIIIGNHPIINISNATYTGAIPNEETYKYFHLTDIGILLKDSKNSPFLENSMPLKIVQYSALDKTVIVPYLTWIDEESFNNVIMFRDFTIQNIINNIKEQTSKSNLLSVDSKWDKYNWLVITKKIESVIDNCYK
jgi:hypothetical protein